MSGGAGRGLLTAVLLASGIGWGLGVPFWKVAASTGHDALGLTAWQLLLALPVLLPVLLLRRARLPTDRRGLLFLAGLALLGAVGPSITYYLAIARLPAGIMAITVATVPMLALVIGSLLGLERPGLLRVAGVALGFAAVALLAAPGGLPAPGLLPFLGLALLTAFLYACEANFIVLRQPPGLDPVAAILGASLLGALVIVPLALATGGMVDLRPPWGAAERAILAGSALNAASYAAYVWLAGRAGPVFAAQTGYVVTVTGVLASLALLGERLAGPAWLALVLMLAGLSLVRPREAAAAARRDGGA